MIQYYYPLSMTRIKHFSIFCQLNKRMQKWLFIWTLNTTLANRILLPNFLIIGINAINKYVVIYPAALSNFYDFSYPQVRLDTHVIITFPYLIKGVYMSIM